MGRPSPASQAKRNRERNKQERRQEKEGKRLLRREAKKERAAVADSGSEPAPQGFASGPLLPVAGEK
jgi:hypothetical protein